QETELKKIKYAKIGFVKNTMNPKLELELIKRTLKKEIEKNSIISFDLFDTLFLRIFYKPEDVFIYLEKRFQAIGFKENRVNAEILAKKKKGCYPKYDDIYQCIDKKFYYLKEYEKKLEFSNIYVNPLMKDIFEYAKSLNKKIIFTTDMYHDKAFFVDLLHKNDICNYNDIYISGEIGKSKESGELFLYINEQLNIKDNTVLHIGDNYIADYLKPKDYNWNSFHIHPPFNYFSKYDQISSYFLARKDDITSSIILGFILKKWLYSKSQYEYWKNIGYCYGGPICYALAKFTYNEAVREKLCNFIFVARDGFVIKKIFDLIQSKQSNKKIKTHYIRAPRIINLLINLDLDSNFSWDKAGSIIRSFKQYFINFEKININKLTYSEKINLIKSNWNRLMRISKIKYLEYCKYIDSFKIRSSKIGFFDLSANSFSSMKIFRAVFPTSTKIKGYYWNVLSNAYKNKFDYKAFNSLDTFLDDYAISELLITSNELPIVDIMSDGEFKFLDNKLERQRVQVVSEIIEGEIEFSKNVLSIFSNKFDLIFDSSTLIDYINYFTNNVSFNDRYFLENIYQAVNEDHTRYMKLQFSKDKYNFYESKPIGAVIKIKFHLSYKLGYALVSSRNFIDFIKLPVILISIIIAHKNQSKLFNFLPLDHYADYEEACRVKGHLSYLLGAYLLKHPFKFIFNFKRILNDFRKNKK
ncbi:TPA: HAD-IA family hydrolase, partial [Campylobacter jejuni]|nr:HAD-IA family hydrolase [Campylobacter jejuni]